MEQGFWVMYHSSLVLMIGWWRRQNGPLPLYTDLVCQIGQILRRIFNLLTDVWANSAKGINPGNFHLPTPSVGAAIPAPSQISVVAFEY
jgi:hypothetical protein